MASCYRTFLTATWADLALVNWEVPAAVLSPFIPRGTVLDTWNGRAFVSLVAFRFLNSRILSIPVPWHGAFEEANLRFYVSRNAGGEIRRGVVFIKEIVPRTCVALVARVLFNENYVKANRMSHLIGRRNHGTSVQYDWTINDTINSIVLQSEDAFTEPLSGSHEQFIVEHYWGYGKRRNGATIEYRVAHRRWRVATACCASVNCNSGIIYGESVGQYLGSKPFSVFLADGSDVDVSFGRRLEDA